MGKRIIIIEDDYGYDNNYIPSLSYNPCEYCINNPANNPNASGFCNCMLPYLNNPTY